MIFYWLISFVLSFFPTFEIGSFSNNNISFEFLKHAAYYIPFGTFISNLGIFIGVLLVALVVRVIIDLL